ncbi:MAG: reverse transcriptase domain-containing protein, partial [Aeromonas sp.]
MAIKLLRSRLAAFFVNASTNPSTSLRRVTGLIWGFLRMSFCQLRLYRPPIPQYAHLVHPRWAAVDRPIVGRLAKGMRTNFLSMHQTATFWHQTQKTSLISRLQSVTAKRSPKLRYSAMLNRAAMSIGLQCGMPPSPKRSQLDSCFLGWWSDQRARSAPVPFLPEVHEELSKSWNAPFLTRRGEELFVVIDLQDTYFHVSILPRHRQFLRFAFEGRGYQYKVLPFGLALSPGVFTKLVETAIAPVRAVHRHRWTCLPPELHPLPALVFPDGGSPRHECLRTQLAAGQAEVHPTPSEPPCTGPVQGQGRGASGTVGCALLAHPDLALRPHSSDNCPPWPIPL